MIENSNTSNQHMLSPPRHQPSERFFAACPTPGLHYSVLFAFPEQGLPDLLGAEPEHMLPTLSSRAVLLVLFEVLAFANIFAPPGPTLDLPITFLDDGN